MNLKEYLEQQREDYIKAVQMVFMKVSHPMSVVKESFLECLETENISIPNEKEIFDFFRFDVLCKGSDGYFYDIKVNVNPDFEMKAFKELDIEIVMKSFVWNACEFSFTLPSFDPNSLSAWFKYWIKPNKQELSKNIQETVHSISFEKKEEEVKVFLDFGTVHSEGIIELINLLCQEGVKKLFVQSMYE